MGFTGGGLCRGRFCFSYLSFSNLTAADAEPLRVGLFLENKKHHGVYS